MGKEAEPWAEGWEYPASPELDCPSPVGVWPQRGMVPAQTGDLCRLGQTLCAPPGQGIRFPGVAIPALSQCTAGRPWWGQGLGKDPAHLRSPPGPDPSCVGRKET